MKVVRFWLLVAVGSTGCSISSLEKYKSPPAAFSTETVLVAALDSVRSEMEFDSVEHVVGQTRTEAMAYATAQYLVCECVARRSPGECLMVPIEADELAPGELELGPTALAMSAYHRAERLNKRAQFAAALYFYRCAIKLKPNSAQYRDAYHDLFEELYPRQIALPPPKTSTESKNK